MRFFGAFLQRQSATRISWNIEYTGHGDEIRGIKVLAVDIFRREHIRMTNKIWRILIIEIIIMRVLIIDSN